MTGPHQPPAPRADLPALLVGITVPLVAGAAILLAEGVWSAELPSRIATHWDLGGTPDSLGPRTGFVTTMVAVTVGVSAAMTMPAGLARLWAPLRRGLLGWGAGCAVLMSGIGIQGLAVQRLGGTGTLEISALLWPVVAGAVIGVAAARVPRDLQPVVTATSRPAAELPRGASRDVAEHAVGAGGRARVDDGTVVVRGLLGRDVVRLDIDEVVGARPVTISGFWEFGGWGVRMGLGGRYAFVGSGDDAVEVTKADGSTWTITTPRAKEVAGAVNVAADRRPA